MKYTEELEIKIITEKQYKTNIKIEIVSTDKTTSNIITERYLWMHNGFPDMIVKSRKMRTEFKEND